MGRIVRALRLRQCEGVNLTLLKRSVEVFAVKGSAEVNSRQTCNGGDVKVS